LRLNLRPVLKYQLLLILVLFCFQNCTTKYSFKSLLPAESKLNGGNGGGYDGKPDGTYFRYIPGFTCEGKKSYKDLLEIRQGKFYLFENRVDLCAVNPRELEPSQVNTFGLNQEIITYKDHIYKNYPSPALQIPDSLNEVVCRDNFNDPQVEITASFDRIKNTSQSQIYLKESSSFIQNFDDPGTLRTLFVTNVSYAAFKGELNFQVHLDQIISGEFQKFKGEITSSSGTWSTRLNPMNLSCVTGADLEPYIGTFSNKMTLNSTAPTLNMMSLQSLVEYQGSLIGAAQIAPASAMGFNNKPSYIGIYRSLDSGLSWNLISTHQSAPGINSQFPRLLSGGANSLYLYGVENSVNFFISESQDGGLTWTKKMSYQVFDKGSASARVAFLTNDNSIILFGQMTQTEAGIIFARKCSLATWVCTNTAEQLTNHSFVGIGMAAQDGKGILYTAYRFGTTSMNTAIYLSKSLDQGATWNIFETYPSSSTGVDSLAVSQDGQTIIYAGRIGGSQPYMRQSVDGGITWSATTNTCTSTGWGVLQVILAPNNEALNTCYEYLGAPGYANHVNRKPAGSANWTNLFSIAGTSGGKFFTRANQDVLYFDANLATIRTTSDFGTNWSSLNYPPPSLSPGDAQIFSIMENKSGGLFAAGYTTVAGETSQASIYHSSDAGLTWNSSLKLPSTGSAFMSLTKSQKTKNLFASGIENKASWIVYKYNESNSSWALVDKYTPLNSYVSTLNFSFSDQNGTLYTVGGYGFAIFGNYIPTWLVRTSADEGATWTTLDDLQAPNSSSEALGGTATQNGVYVSGFTIDSQNQYQWLIRKYMNGQWSIEDTGPTQTRGIARGMLSASDGSLYAVGEYLDSNKIKHWIVKKKSPGGAWSTVDDFNLSANKDASAFSITEDGYHRILVSGMGQDVNGVQNAVIRAFVKGAWVTVDESLNFSRGVGQSLTPCLGTRVCAAVNSLNKDSMFNGFVRILDQ
jgi:hypothetical protein